MSEMTRIESESSASPPSIGLPDGVVRSLIADELDRIRVVLEEMGLQLCMDPEIVRSHMNVLQTIDEICQRNENLGRTLRASDMISEAGSITLETLRVRLQSAILERMAEPPPDMNGGSDEFWFEI